MDVTLQPLHDQGIRLHGSSSPSGATGTVSHATLANMNCQPLLGCQDAQATLGYCTPPVRDDVPFLGVPTTSVDGDATETYELTCHVFTDVSLSEWGETCLGRAVGGVWLPTESQHINLHKLKAEFRQLSSFWWLQIAVQHHGTEIVGISALV